MPNVPEFGAKLTVFTVFYTYELSIFGGGTDTDTGTYGVRGSSAVFLEQHHLNHRSSSPEHDTRSLPARRDVARTPASPPPRTHTRRAADHRSSGTQQQIQSYSFLRSIYFTRGIVNRGRMSYIFAVVLIVWNIITTKI